MEKIYLDNAATTKPFKEEYDLIKDSIDEFYYNASAGYMSGINAKKRLDLARKDIMSCLGAKGGKFIFTSSATESNNMVFAGLHLRKRQVVLISKGEHPSVYNSAKRLTEKGVIVKEINLNSEGQVDFEHLKELLLGNHDVALVSVMHVSNETGAINNIKALCEFVKSVDKNILFHSDGVQAFGKIEFLLSELGVDMYTVSAHKLYAPRGISGLWIRDNVTIDPLLLGGGQEENLRSSTENVFGAMAFAFAVNKIRNDFKQNYYKVSEFKKELVQKLKSSSIAKYLKVNSETCASPFILSLSFAGIKGEVLANALEGDGLLVSTGSACSTKKAGNRTLEAMRLDKNYIVGSIRLSFSAYDNYDVNYIVESIIKNVLRLESNNR